MCHIQQPPDYKMMTLNKVILSYGILNLIGCDKFWKEMQIGNLKLKELLRCIHNISDRIFTANEGSFRFCVYNLWRFMFRTASLNSYVSAGSVSQSCPTLCNTMDCSSPGSSVHGIFQARIVEWVAISYSRGYSLLRD